MEDRCFKLSLFLVLTFSLELLPISSLAGTHCGSEPERLYFAAKFGSGQKTGRFLIGLEKTGREWIAQIRSERACEAVCTLKNLQGDLRSEPVTLEMNCRNANFSKLESPAILLRNREKSSRAVLQIGSWLKGYERLQLSVDVDRFRAKQFAQNSQK
ncbi:MAG TPA: hypothetical protein VJB59_04950 [Bdellovibrionota bacterium]|nr:hypothetical protein [Bdellovibrionota bacterium]